jgi:hypothetical protein
MKYKITGEIWLIGGGFIIGTHFDNKAWSGLIYISIAIIMIYIGFYLIDKYNINNKTK